MQTFLVNFYFFEFACKENANIMKISNIILNWYKKCKRNLPWRNTSNPYNIWLSEVILQQTQVKQGLSYYLRFVERWPDVPSLAAATEEEVLKEWQGLGYYSRARNLHAAANQVMVDYGGVFPCSYKEMINLKGVGKYTAAAVSSIACGEAVPVVDGNVSRVLSRLFAVQEPVNTGQGMLQIESIAKELLDDDCPGEYNQALMEFGALQCTPVSPDCRGCLLNHLCEAYQQDDVSHYPVKVKKKPSRRRFFYYLIISHKGKVYMQQRNNNDIWRKLYEFPLMEKDKKLNEEALIELVPRFTGLSPEKILIDKISPEIKHILTHRTIIARFIHVEIPADVETLNGVEWLHVSDSELDLLPVPRLIDRYVGGW